MKLLKIAALGVVLFSSGCATQMVWQRLDGRPVDRWAFREAFAGCRQGAWNGYELSEARMKHCMAARGYVWAEAGGYGFIDYGGYGRRSYDDYSY
jgi:hypothetical protein